MNKLIIGLLIGILIGGIGGYFISNSINKPNFDFSRNQELQIDENTKNEIISFFDSNPTNEEVEMYCQESRMNCMYYCMEVNKNNAICETIQIPQNMKR